MGELEILYQAAASPCGVVVLTDNVQLALQRFYKARKAANDEALSCLQLRRNPQKPEEEIWIINQGKRANAEPEAEPQV